MRRKKRFTRPQKAFKDTLTNEEIKGPMVRLITDEGAVSISIEEALNKAREAGIDLVEIANNNGESIVKIIDYGKYKFEKTKKEKENKKRQKVIQVKEVKMGPKIDVGDFDRKVSMARSFLADGDNVKVSMRFRGREMAHTEIGLDKMKKFADDLFEDAIIEKEPSLDGRIMTMVIRPKSKK